MVSPSLLQPSSALGSEKDRDYRDKGGRDYGDGKGMSNGLEAVRVWQVCVGWHIVKQVCQLCTYSTMYMQVHVAGTLP